MAVATEELTSLQYRDLNGEQRLHLAEIIADKNLDKLNSEKAMVYPPNTFYVKYGKRVLDIVFSSLAMIVSAPINLFLLAATFFDVGRPIFFGQERIGKNGKRFVLYKFRNMRNVFDSNGMPLPPDERVTKWGRFVRKTSLDELLNFIYVMRGDMSIIGPRPMPVEYGPRFTQYHDSRHLIRPGLECPLYDQSMVDMTWDNRFNNDVWYVQNISLKTDITMLVLLVKEALYSSQNAKRATGNFGDFLGYDQDGRVIDSNHIPAEYMRLLGESEENTGAEERARLSI